MTQGYLLLVDGNYKKVDLPCPLDMNKMLNLIGSEDIHMDIISCDLDTDRTLFLFMNIYNNFKKGKKPLLNQFISSCSEVQIYGDAIAYLSEPLEEQPLSAEDQIYDLNISIDELKYLLSSAMVEDDKLLSEPKFEVWSDKEKREKWLNILQKIGINNPSDWILIDKFKYLLSSENGELISEPTVKVWNDKEKRENLLNIYSKKLVSIIQSIEHLHPINDLQ